MNEAKAAQKKQRAIQAMGARVRDPQQVTSIPHPRLIRDRQMLRALLRVPQRLKAAGGCRSPRRFATNARWFHSPPGLGLRQPPGAFCPTLRNGCVVWRIGVTRSRLSPPFFPRIIAFYRLLSPFIAYREKIIRALTFMPCHLAPRPIRCSGTAVPHSFGRTIPSKIY